MMFMYSCLDKKYLAFTGKQFSRAMAMTPGTAAHKFVSVPSAAASAEAAQSLDCSAESIIREPVRSSGTDALLVFSPGAFTPPTDYIPLCSDIQALSDLRLWVAIVNPPNMTISTEILEGSFDGILSRLKLLGFPAPNPPSSIDNIFLAGHSWGSWTGRTVALKRAQALIQMGCCFPPGVDDIAQFPKPVLTLNGELDGQLTIAATAKDARAVFQVEEKLGSFNTYGVKPVILIPGMNHAQFSHGVPNKARGDFDAEIPIEQARARVAELVSAFISVNHGESAPGLELEKLEAAVKQTQDMCRSYWEAFSEQGKFGEEYQVELIGLGDVKEDQVAVVQHDFKDNFIYSKPKIEQDKSTSSIRIFISTYLNPAGKYDVVRNLWIKMKSREAVFEALGKAFSPEDISRIAASFNEKTYNRALELVPERAREKFLERGRKVRFAEDRVITKSSIEWIESDVTVVVSEDGFLEVQSPVLISPQQGIPSRFAGMHYMKLLTIAGAMKLILEDCFRDSL